MLAPAIPFANSLSEEGYSYTSGKKDKTRQHNFDIMITSGRPRPARPRMSLPTPVNCSYDAQSGSLNFMFSENRGGVTITILNTTKGTVIYDICSSTPGCCTVMLSDDEGEYQILLEGDNGEIFSGIFDL